MNILIYLIRTYGGVGSVAKEIKEELEKRDHNVHIISREENLGINSFVRSFFRVNKVISKESYDILFTQDWSCGLPLIFRKNHYCYYHGFEPHFLGKILQRILYLFKRNRIFVVGDKLKKKFKESILIPNGISFDKFRDLRLKRKYLGWIDKDAEIISQKELETLSKQVKLPLKIARQIPKEEMNKWYNQLEVFVSYPSKVAGFNLCWLEAMASGVPKILGNENGIGIENLKKSYKDYSIESQVNKIEEIFQTGIKDGKKN